MSLLTVALLQLTAHGYDQPANLKKGDEFCRRAAAMGADVALFPEMWSVGYHFEDEDEADAGGAGPSVTDVWRAPELWESSRPPADRIERQQAALERWRAKAIDRDGPFVRHFCQLARELNLAIALTYLERFDGGPRNSVSLIDRHGEIVLTYAKVHTCAFDLPEACLTPGDDFPVGELDTAGGPVKVGAMICYDREFPESARALMLGGAEIILVPNACELAGFRLTQLMVRACENMVGTAIANYAAPRADGHSAAFHPVAYRNGRPQDTLVVMAGEAEGVYLARFDLGEIRDWRRREAWGNAFRRPHLYRALTSAAVEAPFIRVNAAGESWEKTRRG